VAGSEWSFDEILLEFTNEVDNLCSKKRKEALERLAKMLDSTLKNKLAEPLSFHLNVVAPEKLWEKIMAVLKEVIMESQTQLERKLAGLGVSSDLVASSVIKMKLQAWETLLKVVKEEVADVSLHEKLRRRYGLSYSRFESLFRYDDKGIPRVWKPTDDLDSFFAKAKAESESLLALLSRIDVSIESVDEDIVEHAVRFY
jgi:protein SEY1